MPEPEDHEKADAGLAGRRTALAWTRTAIAFAALGGAILKTSPVAGIIVLALGAGLWALSRIVERKTPGWPDSRRLLVVTITVVSVSLVALVVSLTGSR